MSDKKLEQSAEGFIVSFYPDFFFISAELMWLFVLAGILVLAIIFIFLGYSVRDWSSSWYDNVKLKS